LVAWGALAGLGERLAELRLPPRLFVVVDANVAALYEPSLLAGLLDAGFQPHVLHIPAGEASKSRDQLNAIHDWLAERRAERSEAVMALGGGVVGDLAGFAAATYLRGLPLIQVPMSLLAQVDASIGGKVAIDHPRGKNLIGAFHQPVLVLADTALLEGATPELQVAKGWGRSLEKVRAFDDLPPGARVPRGREARGTRPPSGARSRRNPEARGRVRIVSRPLTPSRA